MGKLFLSRLILLLLMTIGPMALGQEYYCVFKVDGNPKLNDSIPLQKGVFINSGQFLRLEDEDEVVLLDETGAIYELDKKMYIPFKNIEKFTKKPDQTSFTLKYLQFIWNKLWEKEEKENIGVVFRAPIANLLVEPADSIFFYGSAVKFKWEEVEKGEMNHIFLRNKMENDYLKISTNGNTLSLPIDEGLLKNGNGYYWSVSKDEDVAMEMLDFYSFELLDDETYQVKMDELESVISEFKSLGFTEEEVRTTLCEDTGFCMD